MADSVSKMVTPSEIFGIPMGSSFRSASSMGHGNLHKNAIDDVNATSSSTVSNDATTTNALNQANLRRVLSHAHHSAINGELVTSDEAVHGSKSSVGADPSQEVENRDRIEHLYYFVARTGTTNAQIGSENAVPLMLMRRPGQVNNGQTIALSLPPSAIVQTSNAEQDQGQKLTQAVLPQVVAMIPGLPQMTQQSPEESSLYNRGFHQNSSEVTPSSGVTPLDPQWLKALANLLHLHVANSGGTQVLDDSSLSRMVSDQQFLSTWDSTTATTSTDSYNYRRSGLPSFGHGQGMSGTSKAEHFGVPRRGGAQRNVLAEIQPFGVSSKVTDNFNTKETQTLPRVLSNCTTKRQLVFVSPLTTEQDSKTKVDNMGVETGQQADSAREGELSNWTDTRDGCLDASCQNDQDEAFSYTNSERLDCCVPEGGPHCHGNNAYNKAGETREDGAVKGNGSAGIVPVQRVEDNSEKDHDSDSNFEATKRGSSSATEHAQDQMPMETVPAVTEALKTPTFPVSPMLCGGEARTVREKHNLKERKRRARIKEACDLMRQIVPGMSQKTDKATVFEFSARYIHFLKSQLGNGKDKDFLLKYSPY